MLFSGVVLRFLFVQDALIGLCTVLRPTTCPSSVSGWSLGHGNLGWWLRTPFKLQRVAEDHVWPARMFTLYHPPYSPVASCIALPCTTHPTLLIISSSPLPLAVCPRPIHVVFSRSLSHCIFTHTRTFHVWVGHVTRFSNQCSICHVLFFPPPSPLACSA